MARSAALRSLKGRPSKSEGVSIRPVVSDVVGLGPWGAGRLAGTRLDLDEELEATSLEHLGAARVEAE